MDLNKLEEAARAATPGPWVTGEVFAENGAFSHLSLTAADGTELIGDDLGPNRADTDLIAAANPAAVLELIDLVRKQEARISELTIVTGDQHMRLDAVLLVQAGLVEALKFYADGAHFMQHDPSAWDTVSGEPANFYEDENNTATVEDGSVAKHALAVAGATL